MAGGDTINNRSFGARTAGAGSQIAASIRHRGADAGYIVLNGNLGITPDYDDWILFRIP
jgi:hypothetical protein